MQNYFQKSESHIGNKVNVFNTLADELWLHYVFQVIINPIFRIENSNKGIRARVNVNRMTQIFMPLTVTKL